MNGNEIARSPKLERLVQGWNDAAVPHKRCQDSQTIQIPVDPSQRKFLSLESMERGIASMSAGDKA